MGIHEPRRDHVVRTTRDRIVGVSVTQGLPTADRVDGTTDHPDRGVDQVARLVRGEDVGAADQGSAHDLLSVSSLRSVQKS